MLDQYIIQIDTATEVCSVSLSKSGLLLDVEETMEPNQHASQLTLFIDAILKRNGLMYTDLSAIAVGMGPGSYTGLRIGVSTAKGLCYSLDIPLIAVNTLEAMCAGYTQLYKDTILPDFLCPMIDARRMEVYKMVFDSQMNLLSPTAAEIIDEHSFDSYTSAFIVLFGSGAHKFKSTFEDNASVIVDESFVYSSRYIIPLAYRKFLAKEFEDIVYFEPYYLKEFVATISKK